MVLVTECLNSYETSMRKQFDRTRSYFDEYELKEMHAEAKKKSISQVC